jgi:hypothetical protein
MSDLQESGFSLSCELDFNLVPQPPAPLGIIKPVNNLASKIPANITGCSNGDPATKTICPSYILTGASCMHRPSCNLLHVTNWNFRSALDTTSQNNFIDWVNTSTDVEWSNPNAAAERNDNATHVDGLSTRLRSTTITSLPPVTSTSLPPLFVGRDIWGGPSSTTISLTMPTKPASNLKGAWKRPLNVLRRPTPQTASARPPFSTGSFPPIQNQVDDLVPLTSAALSMNDSAKSASQPCPLT